jgi:hypothetical protein
MATNLFAAAHSLQVFDLRPVPASLKGEGLRVGQGSGGAKRRDYHYGHRRARRRGRAVRTRNLNGGFRRFQLPVWRAATVRIVSD